MDEKKEDNEFNYEDLWKNEEKRKEDNLVVEMPRGLPRTGIKGRYIKKKGHVGKVQLKKSWGNYFKAGEGKDIVSD